jgi:branched-chain amino acid transport system substrate-binding protein
MEDALARAGGRRPEVLVLANFEAAIGTLRAAAARSVPTAGVIIGNGAWTHPPAAIGQTVDLDGVYAVDTPSPRELPASALSAAARADLVAWAARHGVPPDQHLPVDADLAFAAALVFFERIVPRARSSAPADLRASAGLVDVAMGDTIVGYGARFDARGDNEFAYPVVVQWRGGAKRIVHPPALATAAPVG